MDERWELDYIENGKEYLECIILGTEERAKKVMKKFAEQTGKTYTIKIDTFPDYLRQKERYTMNRYSMLDMLIRQYGFETFEVVTFANYIEKNVSDEHVAVMYNIVKRILDRQLEEEEEEEQSSSSLQG